VADSIEKYRLSKTSTGLLIVDIQERLCAAMEQPSLERMIQRTRAAIEGARALGLPIVVTEQYPEGLGHTIAPIRDLLVDVKPIEKINFSCAIDEVMSGLGRSQILLAGMEAHICVFQTARDLASQKLTPYVLADAVLSRNSEERQIGLSLCREAGAVITTVESALFDLLGKAGTPEFKRVSQAVK
jgi:nicotinamidase-related amidase